MKIRPQKKPKIIAAVGLLWIMLLGWQHADAQLNKAYFFYKGEEFLSKGMYNRALPFLNTLIAIDSTLSDGWFLRGVAKYNLGDIHGALADFQHATDVNPLLSQAYNYKAITLNRLMRHNQALAEINNALDLKPNSTEYQYTQGVTYFFLKDYAKAEAVFSKMIMFDQTNPDAWLNRGTVRVLTADTLGALADFDHAIALNPFNAFAHFKRGALNADLHKFDAALNDLNRSIELDSTAKEGYFVRAIVHHEQKNLAAALADLNRVVQLDPNHSLGLFNRAIIAYQMGNWQDALLDLTRLTALNPENVLIYFNRAIIKSEYGKLREALADYSTAINIFPDFATAYLNRARVKQQLGDLKGAESDYARGKELAEKYKNQNQQGIFAQTDTSGRLNRLISLESDFNTASRFGMKSNRLKVASVFLPMAKLWVVGTQRPNNHGSRLQNKNIKALNTLNAKLPAEFKLALVTDTRDLPPIKLEKVDSALGQNDNYHLIRGIALSSEGKYTEAHQEYAQALDAAPLNLLLRLTYIASEADMAQFVEGFELNRMSINQPAESHKNRTTIDAYQTAIEALQSLQQGNPNNAYIMYNLGNLHVMENDYSQAIGCYDSALTADPHFASARYNRGLALLLTGTQLGGCEDLSLAGEQGIKQAYEALKRFCKK